MQHIPSTIEEQLLLKAIREECTWDNLPKRLQATLSSRDEWHRRVIDHCIKKRLQWNTCFARRVCKESEYYEEMMRYLKRNLALFPYHLAEYVCRVMRVSPFRYYCDMIFEVMKNEQPYDSIPNFSAADALRLTGIGRNEFIDVMNKCRSKKIMWKLNKSIAKELLPTQPVDFAIEPWWGVCLVNFTLEEFKKLTEEETATIDKICKEEANSYVLFDPDIIKGLFRRGLIYFDVPVYSDDRFKVSRLEGFVSNREQSYEDPIEELLYAVFVVSSENATVAELAATLQADLFQLQAAASFACRLGWAVKLIDPASVLQDSSVSGAPQLILSDDEDGSRESLSSTSMSIDGNPLLQGDASTSENHPTISGTARVAFIVDANITSYLMMGSVSPGLKSHAVTLYEAGKLGDASIAELCKDLTTLEGTRFEGELQEFANHAFSLRCILECLQSGGVSTEVSTKVTNEESNKKEQQSLTSEEPVSQLVDLTINEDPTTSSLEEEENADMATPIESADVATEGLEAEENADLAPPKDADMTPKGLEAEENADMAPLKDADVATGGLEEEGNSDLAPPDDADVASGGLEAEGIADVAPDMASEGLEVVKKDTKRRRKYRVDILRCESLASLAPATLDRLFLRDYDIVVSMVPLPSSAVLPGPVGPIHFGPPSHSSMTPWMKLVLYSSVMSGPLSVVLMKGQCLRLLPAPLANCEKALIWSWDGSSVGGLGGKYEGNLVNGNILLHCLNSLVKFSAILVQPLSKYDLDESGKITTIDIPLPLKNADGTFAPVGKEIGLCEEEISKINSMLSELSHKVDLWTVGYIRLLKLYNERESDDQFAHKDEDNYEWVPLSADFGIPLFSPKLCNAICKRIVSSELLQSESLHEHHEAMQVIRTRLLEVCTEYQATGPAAKLLYQREHAKETSKQLMNYASGRWNPLLDPSSPISGASSEHQRLKLANRQRSRTEVLSFDGSILRSYALTPVYEAATRPIEESSSASILKVEQDDSEKRVVLPGVNLLFDGSRLLPFDIAACLHARQPVSLIAEASSASAFLQGAGK